MAMRRLLIVVRNMKSNNGEIDFYIGPFGVSVDRCILVRDRDEIKLTPRNMEVLAYLAERSDQVVSNEELLDRFWSPIASDHAVHKAIADLRSALGDSVRRQAFIKTLPRRGYKLLHTPSAGPPLNTIGNGERLTAVRRWAGEFGSVLVAGLGAVLALAVFVSLRAEPESDREGDTVTLGVERFTFEGPVPQADRIFTAGLTGAMIDQLSKSRQLKIICVSRNDLGTAPRTQHFRQPPEVDHILRGTLLQAGNQYRVLIHLVRGSDGVHEYSEKFDFDIAEQNLFAAQDRIVSGATSRIAAILDIQMGEEPEARAAEDTKMRETAYCAECARGLPRQTVP